MEYCPGFSVEADTDTMEFVYGEEVFGPVTEKRRIDDVRRTLRERDCTGPEILYSIAMDTGKKQHLPDLMQRHLLYGICMYAPGLVGSEPVRSQGHIHSVSLSCGSSTPEMYEILQGKACIFMQDSANENTKKAYAVFCKAGDKVLVPPGYAHYTVNADPKSFMVFGAWCIRDYGFEYADVRRMGGLSYFPLADSGGKISFEANKSYHNTELVIKQPRLYSEFKIASDVPIYQQYEEDQEHFDFVTNPQKYKRIWNSFIP